MSTVQGLYMKAEHDTRKVDDETFNILMKSS